MTLKRICVGKKENDNPKASIIASQAGSIARFGVFSIGEQKTGGGGSRCDAKKRVRRMRGRRSGRFMRS